MNNFMNKVSELFGQNEVIHYPELYNKKTTGTDLSYSIMVASSAILHDTPSAPNSINWKLI
jgi:hypothetical protein